MASTKTKDNAKKDKSAENGKALTLPKPQIVSLNVRVDGTAPLICHRWSEKARRQMLDKHMKKAAKQKEAKDPEADFRDSLYTLDGGGYGFPSIAFKAAAVRAGTYAELKMTYLRGAFHVLGEMVQIEGSEPEPREDMVRVGMGTADIRYRGQFMPWTANIPIQLNETALSVEQLTNLFVVAGFSVGIGEWRPEKNGQYGRFEVAGVEVG